MWRGALRRSKLGMARWDGAWRGRLEFGLIRVYERKIRAIRRAEGMRVGWGVEWYGGEERFHERKGCVLVGVSKGMVRRSVAVDLSRTENWGMGVQAVQWV